MNLFYWASFSVLVPYLGIYYDAIGFRGTQIGLATGLFSFSYVIGMLFNNFLVDTFKIFKYSLLTFLLINLIGILLIKNTENFPTIMVGIFLLGFGIAPASTIVDEQLTCRLGDLSGNYSYFRSAGPIGFLVASIVAGQCIKQYSITAIFSLHIAILLILLGIYLSFPKTIARLPHPDKSKLSDLLANKTFLILMVCLLLWGLAESGFTQFLALLMNNYGYDSVQISIIMATGTAGEFITFLFITKISNKLTYKQLIIWSFCFQIFHYFMIIMGYSSFTMLFLGKFIGGAAFAFVWPATTILIMKKLPNTYATSAQGAKAIMIDGIGPILGFQIFGLSYQYFSLHTAFRILIIIPILGVVYSLIFLKKT
ncbi:MAG: MFS transporter [Sphaerochaetaceae bacterium]|nr:MFS transporter [Sphaerochaetaceae bacterium]